jgi:hypothetical protein
MPGQAELVAIALFLSVLLSILEPVLPCHRVQFWQTENNWRLGRSYRRRRSRIIPRMVDATDLCPVMPACLNNKITVSPFRLCRSYVAAEQH